MPRARRCVASAASIAPPTPRPCQPSRIVTSSSFATSVPREVEIAWQTTHAPTVADVAVRDRARKPDEADLGTREEEIERARERRRAAVAVDGARCEVVSVVAQERAEQRLGRRRASPPSSARSRSRRALRRASFAAFRDQRLERRANRGRDRHGSLRRPVDPDVDEASRRGRLVVALPEEPDLVASPTTCRASTTRRPASIVSGNVSGFRNRHAVSTTRPIAAPSRCRGRPRRSGARSPRCRSTSST